MTPDRTFLVIGLTSGLVSLVAFSIAMLLREAAKRDLERRVLGVIRGAVAASAPDVATSGGIARALLQKIGESLRSGTRLYSADDLAAMEATIAASGFNPRTLISVTLGAKVCLAVLLPLAVLAYGQIAELRPMYRIISVALALPVGLLLPDWILKIPQASYRRALRRGVADALDLLVVCSEAGMGLESGLEEVAKEMKLSNPPISAALSTLLDELRVLPDRRDALANFGKRSGVEGIRRMATMLAQSLQYGTPLGQALRAVSTELRRERVIRLEARAVRLPALLVFPLVVFILPSCFIVMGGVSMLRLLDLLTTLSQ